MKVLSLFAFLPALALSKEWGPSHLEEVCGTIAGGRVCHEFGKIRAPLDYNNASVGTQELVYFVNSDFWDPVNKPFGPIWINMAYGSTGSGYTDGYLRQVDASFFPRGMPGTSVELAEELGALIINVPNRYYGCDAVRLGARSASCPVSIDDIPSGEQGQGEAHERLKYLSLQAVVDDVAHVARESLTTYAEAWGMRPTVLKTGRKQAVNKPIVFGCSWPGAAAVYARMSHPDLFPGAVATSMPLSSSPEGNNFYRSFVGHVYELYSAGGSLECRNVLSTGHEEIRRRIESGGVDRTPVGSCQKDCRVNEQVNADFGIASTSFYSFGGGIPGLPGVQNINRDCTTLGCNIESTCNFILNCFEESTDANFPISSGDRDASSVAYECLRSFTEARRGVVEKEEKRETEADLMTFNADLLAPAYNLGPRVFQSTTLTYQMFGFKGPLWMTQTCNDGSGCPFVQGSAGGASYEQINANLWNSYALPGQSEEEFVAMMREEAKEWQSKYGGQAPWRASPDANNIYMVYNDADPWTGPGAFKNFPRDQDLSYDLGGGGVAHCVYNPPGAADWIRQWASVTDQEKADAF